MISDKGPLDRPGASSGSAFGTRVLGSLRNALDSARRAGVATATRRHLKRVAAALSRGDVADALRQMDRAWRSATADTDLLASLYGCLLSVEGRDYGAALGLLKRVANRTADRAALEISALLHLQRADEARAALDTALHDFCVAPDGLLAHVASRVLAAPDTAACGWIGRNAALEFCGGLRPDESVSALHIHLAGGADFMQPINTSRQSAGWSFGFKSAAMPPAERLTVTSRGRSLLGTGCRAMPEFSLDGRAWSDGRTLRGWVRCPWSDAMPAALSIEDEQARRFETRTALAAQADSDWSFTIDLRRAKILGSRIDIAVLRPDGAWQPLPGMPLLLEAAVCLPRATALPKRWTPAPAAVRRRRGGTRRSAARRAGVVIIIPVYRGRRETLDCIEAAIATAGDARVVVVDDATDDAVLAAALDEFEADGRIGLLRNPVNLGFVGSVNRALARHRTRDAVLLNSDAVVFGDWLTRLQRAAYSAAHVGTVTPWSNSGSIASYPQTRAESLTLEDAATLHRLTSSTHGGATAEIPVGVGFCLYLRRDCLDEVGDFDAAVFGKGYGEETDFCLRARDRGWSHRLAADVFVYHGGGRSFGSRRDALLHRSQRLLNLRDPGFDRFIADFIEQDPLHPARRRLDELRLAAVNTHFVLLVTLGRSGGVSRYVTERCRSLRAAGLFPLILRPVDSDPGRCELWTDALEVPNLQYRIPRELAALTAVFKSLSFDAVEIQHFLNLDARVIDVVRGLGIPYDVMLHDYAWICPRVTLLGGDGRYCREPPLAVCESCIAQHGSQLGEEISVSALRQRSASWLGAARRVSAPSADAATRFQRHFALDIEVRPHSSIAAAPAPRAPRKTHGVARVVLLGAIGHHKGYGVLLDCARDAGRRGLPLEFVVIGYTEDDAPLLKTGRVFITGRYSEGEASHLLLRERPDVIFLASVWPETWCYVLDEALASGLPIVAFDMGAVGDRLRAAGVGRLLSSDAAAAHINNELLKFRDPTPLSPPADNAMMPTDQENTTRMSKPARGSSTPQEGLSASVQVLPLAAGLYLFSVKAAATAPRSPAPGLQLPALQVGLGPGVPSSQVEFIAGPTTDGTWLFAAEDCLVTKVNAGGAALVLTSVRGPGGETLAIKVERLDARNEAASPALAAAPAVAVAAPDAAAAVAAAAPDAGPLSVQVAAHIRSRGDMIFKDAPWAGRIAPGLWIESFAVKPLQHFEAQDIEYKALTGSGFETPWLSDAAMCGTKGMAVPLVGFAIRLKPSRDAAAFDCEYSGYFKSGAIVGPLRNGTPCRSTVANDPLEGIALRIVKRAGATLSSSTAREAAKAATPKGAPAARSGPSFGRYRDGNGHATAVVVAATAANGTKVKPAAKPAAKSHRKPNGTEAPSKRPALRRS